MKKVIACCLACVMAFALVGCSGEVGSKYHVEGKSALDHYMETGDLKLTAKEVQFDMANNLDKQFALKGVGELSDYYNYGYSNLEETFFCVYVTPIDETGEDPWYVYFNRVDDRKLYDILLKTDAYLELMCTVTSVGYKSGQGNLAFGFVLGAGFA